MANIIKNVYPTIPKSKNGCNLEWIKAFVADKASEQQILAFANKTEGISKAKDIKAIFFKEFEKELKELFPGQQKEPKKSFAEEIRALAKKG